MVATPRFYARVRSTLELRAARAGAFKRTVYRLGMRQLDRALAARLEGRRASFAESTGRLLVGRWVLDKAGLLHVRYAGVGGGPVVRDLLEWYWRLGLPLHEQYGQVEAGGIAFSQRGIEDAGTAGTPLGAEIEARVAPDGELYLRTPGQLVGRLDAAGSELVDGWLATGDLAELDAAGRAVIRDRRSSVLVTSAGETVLAGEVAGALERSPYVATAVVVAEGRPFVTALIELEPDAVVEWAKAREKPVTTYAALAVDDDVAAAARRAGYGRERRPRRGRARARLLDHAGAAARRANRDRNRPARRGARPLRGRGGRAVRRLVRAGRGLSRKPDALHDVSSFMGR